MEQQVGSVIAAVDDAAAAMAAATAALDANAGLNASDGAAVWVVDANVGSDVASAGSNGANAGGNLVLKETKDGMKSDGTRKVKAIPPKVGMSFASLEEAFEFYDNYALEQGFSITRCSSAKGSDGEHRFQTFACHRAGKPRTNGKSCVKRKATAKTNCLARICCSLGSEGRWKINTVVLEHTHPLSPGMPEFLQRSRFRRRIEWYDTGHSLSRNVRGFEIGSGNDSSMSYLTKDCTEQIGNEKGGFIESDAQAILRLLLRLQKGYRDFFYAIDSDSGGRLRNAFWGDARSRAAYQEFSDVVLFDTWNLLNRCSIQVALFLGINHHGQLILLGCALLSDDSADTYIWLFREWLGFMSNIASSAIITDQCENIGKAMKSVFPVARHRWCLWHILTKYPEKMNQHKRYDGLKVTFLETIYEAINVEEFEEKWAAMIQEYDLHDNDWFSTLYKGREHWLPVFVKQSFWAGISPIQRNETMPSYFDGYIQPRSTVKQFVDQFEVAMKDKLEKEIESDFRCMGSSISCATAFGVEKQFQVAYTKNIFASVQEEVTKVIYCEADLTKVDGIISEYEVQDKLIAANGASKRQTFGVFYNGETGEVECSCRLFEFKGILCRHAFRVLIKRDIESVPSKYVLRRWRKDIRRCYNKIKTGYVDVDFNVEMKRLRELEKIFYNATDLAAESTDKYEFLLKLLQEASNKLEKWNTSADR